MLEKGGHWGRHYMAPQAKMRPVTLWERLMAWLKREPQEGRRAIVPGMPIDNHAAGWYPATLPGRREQPCAATNESQCLHWPSVASTNPCGSGWPKEKKTR